MNIVDGGWQSYAALFIVGFGMTAPWRIMGILLGRNIDVESEIFKWVRAVSTALVAGLIARMVIFPSGDLATIILPVRLGAFLGGVAVYHMLRAHLGLGVFAALVLLLAGQIMLG
jgi:hypothetical protein